MVISQYAMVHDMCVKLVHCPSQLNPCEMTTTKSKERSKTYLKLEKELRKRGEQEMINKYCHDCDCKAPPKKPVSYDCPCYCCLHGHTDLCPK